MPRRRNTEDIKSPNARILIERRNGPQGADAEAQACKRIGWSGLSGV
jgi:hypothetical protein